MNKYPNKELPIRIKVMMRDDIVKIIESLHRGNRKDLDHWIEDLKTRSLFLSEQIQGDVLAFSEQVCFQYDYDPWHKVTREVELAANKLIEDLGFFQTRFDRSE